MADLPPGFTLDQPPKQAPVPFGFKLDAPPAAPPSAWEDVKRTVIPAVGRMVTNTLGAVGDLGANMPQSMMTNPVAGLPMAAANIFRQQIAGRPGGGQAITAQAENATGGPWYKPQTFPGKATETGISLLPALVAGPEGLAAKALAYGAPLAGSLGLRKAFEGTPLEEPMAAAGTVLGGIGSGVRGTLPQKVLAAPVTAPAKLASVILGGLTGAGAKNIEKAFTTGYNKTAFGTPSEFAANLRTDVPFDEVVPYARKALDQIRAERGAQYRSGMVDISNDKTVLDFNKIDSDLAKMNTDFTFKGVDKSPATATVRGELQDAIDKWKSYDPAEYHTPEGMDALKQQVKSIRDSYDYGTPQHAAADRVFSSVRQAVADQAPTYDKVMGDYSKASDVIDQLNKELSLKKNVNPNTTLRKLQSSARTDANTGWGSRANLVNMLEQHGAPDLSARLSGQALSQYLPRGMAGVPASLELATLAALHNPAAAAGLVPLMAASSPRLAGEGSYFAGQAAGLPRMFINNLFKNMSAQAPAPAPQPMLGYANPYPGLFGR